MADDPRLAAKRDGFGARWWRESLVLGRWSRVGSAGLVGGAALALGGCAFDHPETRMEPAQSQDAVEVDQNVDALTLQQNEGWNTGVDRPLLFPASTDRDIAGTESWRQSMDPLARLLEPPPQYLPFYVPTLFQSLSGLDGQGLRAVMRPILTPEMRDDFQRGVALRQQFAAVDWPRDTAIVVDAPGPRAVAIAAALADHFAPVFTFGNWPHPLGVVPAHQTLAAALYYLPAFTAARSLRPQDAPPLFVLDANRLAPYRDADNEFDNRYFASLPTAESLRALGISHVLYVNVDGREELDDLNDQLVGLQGQGLDVKMVALADFVRVDGEPDEQQVAAAEAEEDEDDGYDGPYAQFVPLWWGAPCHWWYRGVWWSGGAFWGDYHWYPHPHGRVVGPPPGHRVMVAMGPRWVPAPRATRFGPPGRVVTAPGGVRGMMHPIRPASFAMVPVRASRSSGEITGVRAGHVGSFGPGGHFVGSGGLGGHFVGSGGLGGRSGSIGRAGGGFGG